MSGESLSQPSEEYTAEHAQAFLEAKELGSLGAMTVYGHGEPMTLSEAMASCDDARTSFEAVIETLEEAGIKGPMLETAMTGHLAKMEQKSQDPSVMHAKKKVI